MLHLSRADTLVFSGLVRWTDTHGHLLQMGGLMVRERDGCCHYLDLSAQLGEREELDSITRVRFYCAAGVMARSSCIRLCIRQIQFNSGSTWSSVSRMAEQEASVRVHPTHVHPSLRDPSSAAPRNGSEPSLAAPPPPPSIRSSILPHHADTQEHLKALLHANIPESDIWDKSKGDAFSKGFALLQTGWFLVQTLARFILGLGVTHLEVTTLAYAALNGVIYWFWWNKPLDIQCPIVIGLGGDDFGDPGETVHSSVPDSPRPIYTSPARLKRAQTRTHSMDLEVVQQMVPERIDLRRRVLRWWRRIRSRSFWLVRGQSPNAIRMLVPDAPSNW